MRWLIAVLGLLTAFGAAADSLVQAGSDTIEIREAEGVAAEVVYNNGFNTLSRSGTYTVEISGVVVDVRIQTNLPGHMNAETITVTPHDPGLIAVPVEIDVPDGESVVIQIMLPLF